MKPALAMLGLMIVSGCTAPALLEPTSPLGQMILVTATGVVNGKFPAAIRIVENQPAAQGFTTFSLVTPKNPGLGIDSFLVNATFVGEPDFRHYDEMEAQMVARLRMKDGAGEFSDVNSQNRIDVISLEGRVEQADGSTVLKLHGHLGGATTSTETPDTLFFEADY